MKKALSLYLPMWPVDLARRREARMRGSAMSGSGPAGRSGSATPPEHRAIAGTPSDAPLLFVTTVANQQRITACCERALQAGVRPGMTLAHARALLPADAVDILDHRSERDRAALHALAEWMTRLAPVVSCDPPEGLLMDLSGCERLYRTDEQMVRAVARACTRLGLRARIALGPTFGSAWAMARFGPARLSLIQPGKVREALAPLPVEALRIDEETAVALREIGIERIGHLLDIARPTLPSRFGDDLLLRLDQALGEAMEVIEPVRPAPPPEAHMAFTGPTTQREAIEEASRRLLRDLCGRLTRLQHGVRRLDVTLERIDADNVALALSLSHPNRDERHLWSMLAPKLERVNLGFGVESIRLVATKTARLRHTQAECWNDEDAAASAQAERATGELIDTLVGRLGADRIVRLDVTETHIPERVFHARSVGSTALRAVSSTATTDADRPTTLFARPEPAQVLAIAPEGPPKWLKWRGEEHPLISAIGPERITEEWWTQPCAQTRVEQANSGNVQSQTASPPAQAELPDPPARDYFKVQTESGRWLWLFRRLPAGRWFIHGEWT